MQRDAKNLFFAAFYTNYAAGKNNKVNTVVYNMSGRVESDILCTDLAITCIWKKIAQFVEHWSR